MTTTCEKPSEDGLFEGCTIAVEHAHLCVRNRTGWLLANIKLSDRAGSGWAFDDLIAEATKNQKAWLKTEPRR